MSPPIETPLRYDSRTIALHWLTAGLVAALWVMGQTIDWFAKGDPRVTARSAHIAIGVVLVLVLLRRIWWRLGAGSRLPLAASGALGAVATATHRALYVLLVATVLLGLANAWVRGDTVFNLFVIPAFEPGNTGLRKAVEETHSWSANILLIVAAMHAAAAGFHHFVRKDDVPKRMLSRP